jgi:hypothetical protein
MERVHVAPLVAVSDGVQSHGALVGVAHALEGLALLAQADERGELIEKGGVGRVVPAPSTLARREARHKGASTK